MEHRGTTATMLLISACATRPAVLEPCPTPNAPSTTSDAAPVTTPACSHCCASRDTRGPEVVEALLLPEAGQVELRFSEPVALPRRVAPDQFRLSFVQAEASEGEASVAYYDPAAYTADADAPILLTFTELEQAGPTRIILLASQPLGSELCETEVTEADQEDEDGQVQGLFLHYSAGKAGIDDLEGNSMRSFGASWATQRHATREWDGKPPVHRLDLLVRVRCKDGGEP